MKKYFGTDGYAYKISRFLGWYYNMLRECSGDTNPSHIVIEKASTIVKLYEMLI